jgi:hypothetical protein
MDIFKRHVPHGPLDTESCRGIHRGVTPIAESGQPGISGRGAGPGPGKTVHKCYSEGPAILAAAATRTPLNLETRKLMGQSYFCSTSQPLGPGRPASLVLPASSRPASATRPGPASSRPASATRPARLRVARPARLVPARLCYSSRPASDTRPARLACPARLVPARLRHSSCLQRMGLTRRPVDRGSGPGQPARRGAASTALTAG